MNLDIDKVKFDKDMIALLCYWMMERERIRIRRFEEKKPKPWTDDPILQEHKFCNARRMDDRVSIWLLQNWYDNAQNPRTLLIAAALARMINWPDSLAVITSGAKFNIDHWHAPTVRDKLLKHEARGQKVFTGAYIINGAAGGSKIVQVVNNVRAIAEAGEPIIEKDSMQRTHAKLMKFQGVGSFIAGQIVADLRFTSAMKEPEDRLTWAPLGPGSMRGMNKLMAREPKTARITQAEFDQLMPMLLDQLRKMKRLDSVMPRLEAMDVQNCLCEFDKYTRLKFNEGKVRSRYPGTAESGTLEGV